MQQKAKRHMSFARSNAGDRMLPLVPRVSCGRCRRRSTVARRVPTGLALILSALLLCGCQHLVTYRSAALGCSFKYPPGFDLQSELPANGSDVATFGEVRDEGGTWVTDAHFAVTGFSGTSMPSELATNIANAKAEWRKALGSTFVRFTGARRVTVGGLRGCAVTAVDRPSESSEEWVDELWVLSGSRTYLVWLYSPASDWPTIGPQLRNVALTIKPVS